MGTEISMILGIRPEEKVQDQAIIEQIWPRYNG